MFKFILKEKRLSKEYLEHGGYKAFITSLEKDGAMNVIYENDDFILGKIRNQRYIVFFKKEMIKNNQIYMAFIGPKVVIQLLQDGLEKMGMTESKIMSYSLNHDYDLELELTKRKCILFKNEVQGKHQQIDDEVLEIINNINNKYQDDKPNPEELDEGEKIIK